MPDQVLINTLNNVKLLAALMLFGKLFHIFGPSALSVFDPYLLVFCDLTMSFIPFLSLLVFIVKIYFMKGGFKSFIVLKISIANILKCFTSNVVLPEIVSRCSYSDS